MTRTPTPNPSTPDATRDAGADTTENRGYNQHGQGKGGKLGRGEPEGERETEGSTQPNFGQAGTYGKDPR